MKKMIFSIQIVGSVMFLFLFMMLSTSSKAQTDLNSFDPYAAIQNVHQKGNGKHISKLEHRDNVNAGGRIHGSIHLNDSGLHFLNSNKAIQNLGLAIENTRNDMERYHGELHDALGVQIRLFKSIIKDIESGMSVRDAAIANYNKYKEKFSSLNGFAQKVEAKLILATTYK